MTRRPRWLARLLHHPPTDTPGKDPAMPTDTDPDTLTADERIAALRDELAQIAAHEAADPLDAAADLDAWHQRNDRRSRRRAEIERQTRDLTAYGLLVDTHLTAIRAYLSEAAEIRAHLAPLAAQRQTNSHRETVSSSARVDIIGWYSALIRLARALPFEHPDAQRVLDREYQAWLTARNGWAIMLAAKYNLGDGGWLPSPECGHDGGLPPGMSYGVYRIAEDGTVVLPGTASTS